MASTQQVATSGKTQCQLIVEHVRKNGGITSWEAIQHYGITRLAARIYDLNNTGASMKAEEIGDGYVRYVPDYKARSEYYRRKIDNLMFHGSPSTIAEKLPQMTERYCQNLRLAIGKPRQLTLV
ncbi:MULTISPECIES: helix-turn-helix domain-containing protein [unclassified Marinobacter]|uniref:helix-turn-helix domain-containing protein n=1 Tax=unclassified Marinobacter TaxID=83889 RepID=UPI001267B5AD|nr:MULTISPECIES: helix-turn-helix domain-containing protein [unclassified Marinobacter]QFS87603.1 hypothetical protein FIV08_12290 [Marinobacter sp. THAF197a]QFT51388.1 hypothetical protein FIU96_12205 [Marinobacter sp. THAF39]